MQDAIEKTIESLETKIRELQSAISVLRELTPRTEQKPKGETPKAKPPSTPTVEHRGGTTTTKYNVGKGELIRVMAGRGALSPDEIAARLSAANKGARYTVLAITNALEKYSDDFDQVEPDKYKCVDRD